MGQSHAIPASLQQRGAHHLLKAVNLLAERRLRHVHPLCRFRECAGIGNRDEITQVPELNALRRDSPVFGTLADSGAGTVVAGWGI
jgi:hypothetical protein